MFDVQIADINLTMPLQDFETEMKKEIGNYHVNMQLNIIPMSTKRGKSMYKITVENDDNSVFTIIAEQDANNGDVQFHPLIMQSINNSFYQVSYNDPDIAGQDEDPSMFFCTAMSNIARHAKGTFAYITPNGHKSIVSNGSFKTVRSVGLVDSDGNVYACSGAKKLKGDTEDIGFSINQPIGEWLDEHREVKAAVATLPLDQKMNYIGKWLVQARIKEEIESDEFMDIFRQAGIFGFSDASVQHIYKLIM